jgi:RNA polymerase sigma factor (sigma-70 family)
MKDSAKCFILEHGRYQEITFGQLKEYIETNPAFQGRRFVSVQKMLVEVRGEEYKAIRKDENRLYYLRKKESKIQMVPYHLLDDEGMVFGASLADAAKPVEEMVSDLQDAERLHAALGTLTEDERGLITAAFFDGESERNLAKTLGISQQAVHKRIHKIISKLKTKIIL